MSKILYLHSFFLQKLSIITNHRHVLHECSVDLSMFTFTGLVILFAFCFIKSDSYF